MIIRKKAAPYVELALLLLAIVASGLLLNPDDPLWARFQPSPYWLPVLLMALRYGNPPGLTAAAVCAVLQMAGACGFNLPVFYENIFLRPESLLLPGALLLSGHFIGESIHSCRRRAEYYRAQFEESGRTIDDLEKQRANIEQTYRQLEGQIAGESGSLYSLLHAFEALEHARQGDIPRIAATLLTRYVRADKTAFWRHEHGVWRKLYPADSADAVPALLETARRENQTVTARDFPREAQNADCQIAGVFHADERTYGLSAGEIQFSVWHGRLEKVFHAILQQIRLAHIRCAQERLLNDRQPIDSDLGLAGEAFLRQHVHKALLSQQRSGGVSALLFLRPVATMREDERLLTIIASALRCLLRASDAKAYLHEARTFAVFMPNTPESGAELARDKLLQELHGLALAVPAGPVEYAARLHTLTGARDLDPLLHAVHREDW